MSDVDTGTRETLVEDRDYILELIARAAELHGLDPTLVAAVVEQETAESWDPWVSRWELRYRWLWHPTMGSARPLSVGAWLEIPADWPAWLPWKISGSTEFIAQKHSWGLMQLMGANARELGFSRPLTELSRAHLGLEYGCRFLRRQLDRYAGDVALALEAYNDGRGDGMGPGVEYAREVLERKEALCDV